MIGRTLSLLAGAVMLVACTGEDRNGSSANMIVMSVPADGQPPAAPAPAARPTGIVASLVPPTARVAATDTHPDDLEVAFSTTEPPARVVDWYRRNARIGSEMTEGAEQVLTGQLAGARREWTVRLSPDDHGGTAAMLLVTAP